MSYLGTGHPENPIVNESHFVKGKVLEKLTLFIENKLNRSFNYASEITWSCFSPYPIEEIVSFVKGRGIKKDSIDELINALERLKLWNKEKSTRIPFSKEDQERISRCYETEDEHEKRQLDYASNRKSSVQIKDIHRSSLLRILEQSNHIDAQEILQYVREDLKPKGILIEEDVYIDWHEAESGYDLVTKEDYSPTVTVVGRWDAVFNNHKVSLIRTTPRLGYSSFCAYVNLDTSPVRIAFDINSRQEANKAVKKGIDNLYPAMKPAHFSASPHKVESKVHLIDN